MAKVLVYPAPTPVNSKTRHETSAPHNADLRNAALNGPKDMIFVNYFLLADGDRGLDLQVFEQALP